MKCREHAPAIGTGILQGRRTTQEDVISVKDVPSVGNEESAQYFAVFDGHMGGQAAAFAGEKLHTLLTEHPDYARGKVHRALRDSILQLDKLYGKKAMAEGLSDGSTVVAGVLEGNKLTIAHVGDSRYDRWDIWCMHIPHICACINMNVRTYT
jgi:protein phosphatase 2C family protein 2/3